MKKTKRKLKIPQPYNAIVKFLEKNGWNVVVIGGSRIRQNPLREFNYSIEFDFTGGKKPDPLP